LSTLASNNSEKKMRGTTNSVEQICMKHHALLYIPTRNMFTLNFQPDNIIES